MTAKPVLRAAVAASVGLALAGCAADGQPSTAGSEVSVLAAFYPFEFVAERVGGQRVSVENLTAPGAEPHDLELTPRQVAAVGEADLVVYLEGFQPAVDEAVEQAGPAAVLEVGQIVPLAGTGEGDGEGAESADEHGGDGDHDGEHAADPHIWLDPIKLAEIADATAAQLAEVDPAGTRAYQAGADALRAELTDLDAEFKRGLSSCDRRAFVVSHAAFGHLAAAYGLEQIGISGLSPQAEPSVRRIAEVQQIVRDRGVTTIFYETLVSPRVARTMADDLGVRTAVLDPLEGLADDAAGDYLSIMRSNLAALREANGCAS